MIKNSIKKYIILLFILFLSCHGALKYNTSQWIPYKYGIIQTISYEEDPTIKKIILTKLKFQDGEILYIFYIINKKDLNIGKYGLLYKENRKKVNCRSNFYWKEFQLQGTKNVN